MRFAAIAGISILFIGAFQNCSGSLRSAPGRGALPDSLHHGYYTMSTSTQLVADAKSAQEQVNILKTRGCMMDSLVFPLGADFDDNVEVLKRSQCAYLQRVVETWATPPNFAEIVPRLEEIRRRTGKNFIFGMFIAEAISTKAVYTDDGGQRFDFAAMCATGSVGKWGPDTCVPVSTSTEYRRYVRYIVDKAMDAGIRDFLFGQLGHIDGARVLPALLRDLRAMAAQRGIAIAIGGQPNGVMAADYLQNFDYATSPAYIDVDVSEKCMKGTNCQAIYFHPELADLPRNLIIEIDWASQDDDAHHLGKKSRADRHRTIYELSRSLKARKIGFVFPFRIWYDGGANGACEGINQWVYSASNSYGCRDEDAWNAIMQGQIPAPAAELEGFVREQYLAILKRAGAPAEVAYWVDAINEGRHSRVYLSAHFAAVCASGAEPCGRLPKRSCNLAGRSIAHGESVDAYPNSVLPYGSTCGAVTRTCNDGVMSGSSVAVHLSCVVNAPVALSDADFVHSLYLSIFKRWPDPGAVEFWTAEIRAGRRTRNGVQAYFYSVCQSGGELCGRG